MSVEVYIHVYVHAYTNPKPAILNPKPRHLFAWYHPHTQRSSHKGAEGCFVYMSDHGIARMLLFSLFVLFGVVFQVWVFC